jgi:hypothetical protein
MFSLDNGKVISYFSIAKGCEDSENGEREIKRYDSSI